MRRWLILCGVLLLTGCGLIRDRVPDRIALLAPFEGRGREIGYNALYAARLALADSGGAVALLPIDDGGTVESAADRAAALQRDERVQAVLLLGTAAADPLVQAALGDLPAVIVGGWTTDRAAETVFLLAAQTQAAALTIPVTQPITDALPAAAVVGEIGGLAGFPLLHPAFDRVTYVTSGDLPPPDFTERYLSSDLYVPPPNPLAIRVYDATAWLAALVTTDPERGSVAARLSAESFTSQYSGALRFTAEGWWDAAPLHTFTYEADGTLIRADGTLVRQSAAP